MAIVRVTHPAMGKIVGILSRRLHVNCQCILSVGQIQQYLADLDSGNKAFVKRDIAKYHPRPYKPRKGRIDWAELSDLIVESDC